MGKRYVLPRKLTGMVPLRCSSSALEPLGKAVGERGQALDFFSVACRI